MDKLSSISIREHLELDNIKELIDNIVSHPNRVIINEILKLGKNLQLNIEKLDISRKQKDYYKNIIENSDLLEELQPKDDNDDEEEDDKEDNQDQVFSYVTFPAKKTIKFEDPNLVSKTFPRYKILNTEKYNSNLRKLTGKILFY